MTTILYDAPSASTLADQAFYNAYVAEIEELNGFDNFTARIKAAQCGYFPPRYPSAPIWHRAAIKVFGSKKLFDEYVEQEFKNALAIYKPSDEGVRPHNNPAVTGLRDRRVANLALVRYNAVTYKGESLTIDERAALLLATQR